MKIGIFDSGVGGLTILHTTRALMPHYDYVYYGDTAHIPYGDKSEEEIYTLTRKAVLYLFEHDVLLVVLACNTASAETARKLQQELLVGEYKNRKILGVIIPTVEALLEQGSKQALLIGTLRTVHSKKYEKELAKVSADILLHSVATPSLVPLIESGNIAGAFSELKKTLDTVDQPFDTLILGCTHYPLLKEYIRREYDVTVLSQDEIIPQKLATYLNNHPEIKTRLSARGTLEKILT